MVRAGTVALVLIAVVLLFHAAAQGQRDTQQGLPGRYQLYQVEINKYDVMENTMRMNQNALFRLDTATGKTFEYSEGLDENGVPYKGWIPIND